MNKNLRSLSVADAAYQGSRQIKASKKGSSTLLAKFAILRRATEADYHRSKNTFNINWVVTPHREPLAGLGTSSESEVNSTGIEDRRTRLERSVPRTPDARLAALERSTMEPGPATQQTAPPQPNTLGESVNPQVIWG